MLVFLECRLFFVIFVPFDMVLFRPRQQIHRQIFLWRTWQWQAGNPHVKNRRYIDSKGPGFWKAIFSLLEGKMVWIDMILSFSCRMIYHYRLRNITIAPGGSSLQTGDVVYPREWGSCLYDQPAVVLVINNCVFHGCSTYLNLLPAWNDALRVLWGLTYTPEVFQNGWNLKIPPNGKRRNIDPNHLRCTKPCK